MNHEEINAAVRLSLLMGDTRSERHGCYANRKPLFVSPPPIPPALPLHTFALPVVRENPRPPL
jgi:hypothetical protein